MLPFPLFSMFLLMTGAARTEVGRRVAIPRRIDVRMRMIFSTCDYYETCGES